MKRDYPERPTVAVGTVVIKDGKILLIRRGKEPRSDSWSIPGGKQEWGETVAETAVREVMEETAITIENPQFLEVIDYIDRDADGFIRHHYTLIDYAAHYQSGTIKAGDDALDAKWVSLDKLSDYNLWQETEKIIYKALKKLGDPIDGR